MKWEKFPFKIEKQYRLGGWDYTNNGVYFVTICTKDRLNLFRYVGTDPCVCSDFQKDKSIYSKINSRLNSVDKIGGLNEIGEMINKWWLKIPEKFSGVSLDKYVIMPDHLHGILVINNYREEQTHGSVPTLGQKTHGTVPTLGQKTYGSVPTLGQKTYGSVPTLGQNIFGNVELLGQIIRWFKTMTTNDYIKNVKEKDWPRFSKKLWQSRFHDRIIRDKNELWAKRIYIRDNVINWGKEKDDLLYH